MTRYAIVLSVEDYTDFSRTPFCHADSSLLYATLVDRCDYAPQHILLLQLNPGCKETAEDILGRIQQTVESSKPGDTILFYFAGHGHQARDGKTYIILPDTTPGEYDKTALALDDISGRLRQSDRPCFRIFDACHSGVDVRDGSALPDSVGFIRAVTHDPAGWVTLAACREDQYSVCDPSLGNGIFTHYVCEFIQAAQADEDVLPELIKIGIVDKVFGHAKRLGNSQTPTLNASISGNISLATRQNDRSHKQAGRNGGKEATPLLERISKLQDVPDIIIADFLRQTLQNLVEAMGKEVECLSDLITGVSSGPLISASAIPELMERDVVMFALRNGLNSRHKLSRWEEEVEEPRTLWAEAAILASMSSPKKRKQVHYTVSQSTYLPEAACVIELGGDERCVPVTKILVYVIPLQLKIGLLVSAFRTGWPPNDDELELLCHSYQTLKPGELPESAKCLAPIAIEKIRIKLNECVARRVNELEKELD